MTSSSTLTLFSPAKINLFLHITGKRCDGYHDLQTIFRLLDWGDTLVFSISEKYFGTTLPFDATNLPITLHSTVNITDNVIDNLITKAAIALINEIKKLDTEITLALPKTLPVIDIHLDKVLPTGAGLGGGSSNAATTLIALNQLWGFNLDKETLRKIGSSIGADVAVFIMGEDAIAEGIGEVLTPIKLPHQHYLLLNPSAHVSTQTLFNHTDLKRDTPVLSLTKILQTKDKYLDNLVSPFNNVFEPVVTQIVPEVAEALAYLRALQQITHTTARMTGTGSSVFLPIPKRCIEAIKEHITVVPPPYPVMLTQSL